MRVLLTRDSEAARSTLTLSASNKIGMRRIALVEVKVEVEGKKHGDTMFYPYIIRQRAKYRFQRKGRE